MSEKLAQKVLVIGWDAADWKIIDPLIERGCMPTLQGFMEQGVWGNIATLDPILSPMLWTSIATGKRAYKHGIHGFIEPMPDGKGIRPSSSTTRTCKAIWNILTQEKLKTHQVGWFCSHPAEPINGVCVSNLYDPITTQSPEDWKLPDGAVFPADLAETLGGLRLHPTELDESHVFPFVPNAAKIDQAKDRRLSAFAKLFCEMVNIHSAATWMMENKPWDFLGVYNPAIDHFCHGFMAYHPPQMDGVPDEDFEIYNRVVEGCYRFHDMMLARMLELAGDDTTVVICSDHGFHSDHLRPQRSGDPAVWHRQYGILCMKGPGIKKNRRIYGASVLDITPTILSLFGLPVGGDMDGKPLIQAFDRYIWPQHIASWEDVAGPAGMHDFQMREDPFQAREAIQQLVDLGYIEKPDANHERAARRAAQEAKYNLARSLLDGRQVTEAIALLEDLVRDYPSQLRFGLQLARCYLSKRRRADARHLIEDVIDRAQQQSQKTIQQLDRQHEWIQQSVKWQQEEDKAVGDGRAERVSWFDSFELSAQRPLDGDTAADASKDRPRDRRPLRITDPMLKRAQQRIEATQRRLRNLDVRVTPAALLLMGTLEFYERNLDKALDHLQQAEKGEPRLPGLHIQIGRVYLRMKRPEDALRAFKTATEIDGDSAVAQDGLAAALLRLGKPTAAADHALVAVGLAHHFPRAHFRLGVALARMKKYEQAIKAFDTCSHLAPMAIAPHRWLAKIYRDRLDRCDLAADHLNKVDFIKRNRSTNVS